MINLPNLCPNMNHFDAAVDFSECHSEEVISFFWRSVYLASKRAPVSEKCASLLPKGCSYCDHLGCKHEPLFVSVYQVSVNIKYHWHGAKLLHHQIMYEDTSIYKTELGLFAFIYWKCHINNNDYYCDETLFHPSYFEWTNFVWNENK